MFVVDLLDGQYPALCRDCVTGPEDVVREGATEYIDRTGGLETPSD